MEDAPLRPGGLDPLASRSGLDASEDRSRPIASPDLDGLFRAQGPALLRFFTRRTPKSEDAADLLQEAFARFARLSAPLRLDNPEAYLQRIAVNLLTDTRRLPHNRAQHIDVDSLDLADPYPTAERQLEARQMLARLDACLARLRPRTRQAFLLHRVEGLSYAEIATRMGVSISAVEKHMMKAIAHLDRRLGRG
ncbi:MAG: sigma-70 family RNA polymerase sigma factor [Caulobacteraceae bacterium]